MPNGQVKSKASDFRDSPVAWFVVLERARAGADFERAAMAQRELRRLGVVIRYTKRAP